MSFLIGKSSLMIALYRIENISTGSIFIDDIDISTIKLETLRNVLGIIPQVSYTNYFDLKCIVSYEKMIRILLIL